jgi:hypothetical protein
MLDSGSNTHVSNSLQNFATYRDHEQPEVVKVGNTFNVIHGSGTVLLTVQGTDGPKVLALQDVVYVPGFHVNLVAQSKFRNKGYLFNEITEWIVNTNIHPHQDIIRPFLRDTFWFLAASWTPPTAMALATTREKPTSK